MLPQVSRHPKKNCSQIFASRRTIHPKTFYVCAIVKSHCIRLQCCFQHRNWIENNCACVLLSDESIFSLFSDRRWKLFCLESDDACHLKNIHERNLRRVHKPSHSHCNYFADNAIANRHYGNSRQLGTNRSSSI